MSLHVGVLSSHIGQFLYMAVLVAVSVFTGQVIYRYGREFDYRVRKNIKNRKRPQLRYILFDVFWPTLPLFTAFLVMRAGIMVLPRGEVSGSLVTIINLLLLVVLFWAAIRIIKEVYRVAADTE